MSEPTYRIVTEHDPTEGEFVQWVARVFLLTTGKQLKACYGKTEEGALANATTYLALLSAAPQDGRTMYANEDGELCAPPEPASLRVAP